MIISFKPLNPRKRCYYPFLGGQGAKSQRGEEACPRPLCTYPINLVSTILSHTCHVPGSALGGVTPCIYLMESVCTNGKAENRQVDKFT